MWLDAVEVYVKKMSFRNLRRKSQERGQWRAILKSQGSSWTVPPAQEEEKES
jgi:hypothetical protein